jgi:hypothetical protein
MVKHIVAFADFSYGLRKHTIKPRIRSYITDSACNTLVCSLITSRLDYGNARLYGVNASALAKLQRVDKLAQINEFSV